MNVQSPVHQALSPKSRIAYRTGQLSVNKPRPLASLLVVMEHISRLAVILIGLVVCIYALRDWAGFLIPVTAGIVAGLMLSPADAVLQKHGLPQAASGTLVLTTIAAIGFIASSLLWTPVVNGVSQLPAMGNVIERKVHMLQQSFGHLDNIDDAIKEATKSEGRATVVEVKKDSMISSLLSVAPPALGQVLLFAGTMAFFLFGRLRMREALLRACLSRSSKLRAARIMRDVELNTARYLLTISAINAGLGIVVGLAMYLLGLENAVMWGVSAALLNFIPYLGPAVMVILLSSVGLLAEASLWVTLTPPAVYLVLNFIEFQFVTPSVLGRSLTLAPFAVFLSISFWLWLWGPVGAFLAVPLLLIMVVSIKHLLPSSP